jgi:hypothetical protein
MTFRAPAFLALAAVVLCSPGSIQAQAGDPPPSKAVALIEQINRRLERGGSPLRLTEAWFFTVGRGVDPYRRLRTGAKWAQSQITYLLDQSDFPIDVLPALVEQADLRAFDHWNDVRQTGLFASRATDAGANYDVLDAMHLDAAGNCVDIIDTTSSTLAGYDPATGQFELFPPANIVAGGWLPVAYFANCLGSADLAGITWVFTGGDTDHDKSPDLVYVEQYFNAALTWTTTDAQYLNLSILDIESVVLHEIGHALGLGHFGGPNTREPFEVQPNLKVFDPEAVMNPFYLGGEKRKLFPTDRAALRTLYGSAH